MADARTYIRVHDGMDEHPKIEGLSDSAFRLLHRAWYHCSRQLTDGRLTDAAWRNRGPAKARRELVDAGLVHLPGYDCPHQDCPTPPAGHVQMHDYLDHQRSAAEVQELREKRADAGRRGGKARANALASAKQVPGQVSRQTGSKTEAETETDTEELQIRPVAGATADDRDDGFDAFYEAYPRKEARRKAEQAWRATLKRADADTIMTGLKAFRFSEDRRFIPLPASWLNADRWADTTPVQAPGDIPNIHRDIPPWEM